MDRRGALWVSAGIATVVLFVGYAGLQSWFGASSPGLPSSKQLAAAESSQAAPNSIIISIASSITKREWLEQAVKDFNAASRTDHDLQINARPVAVNLVLEENPLAPGVLTHYRSPTMAKDTLTGKIRPTILSPADEVWVTWLNKEWRSLHGGKDIVTGKPESIARTPVVVAMWQSRATALGCWPVAGPECTWKRLRALAASATGWALFGHPEWGSFTFGYAYVGESDVGTQTAVLLCMSGLKKTTRLTLADIRADNGCGLAIADMEKAKVRSGTSSPWLLEGMVRSGVDAVTTYEKEVIAFNRANGQSTREPLVAVYPQDGTVTAGHPFAIVTGADWVSSEQSAAATVFQKFLLTSERQRKLVETGMRSADHGVKVEFPVVSSYGVRADAKLVTVDVPDSLVLDRIQEIWREVKKPSLLAIVFDKSDSMKGEKITAASKGAMAFVNAMDGKDWIAWLPFDDQIYVKTQGRRAEIGERLIGEIASTPASGGTALYDAIGRAYRLLETQRKLQGKAARYGIVVLSDGQDTNSKELTLALLSALLQPSESDPTGIQIHTIGIGADADGAVLTKIASSAHGKYWKAKTTSVTEVVNIYREIVKYY